MLLNKKRGLLVLSSLFLALLIPLVSAQYEGIYSMFSFLFGTGESGAFIFLKAGIWIILFAIIFWVAKKMFSGSKGIATIFSLVVSLISIRFIPDEYIYYIGSAYGVFGIVVLILAIIGGTLLILNSYFPIKQHKSFGVVWALFYFFIAWVFHQLTGIITGIYQIDELLPVIGPWGKWVCIVLGIICLLRSFSGKSTYARTTQPQYEPEGQDGGGEDQGGKGGSATANASARAQQAQAQMQMQKQKQKQKQGGGGGKKYGAASFDLFIDGSRYNDKDNVQHTTDLRNRDKTSFVIMNGGTGGILYWRAAGSKKALKVEPNVGRLKKRQSVRVNVSVINRNIGEAFVPHVTIIAKRGAKGNVRTLISKRVAKAFIRYSIN